MKITEYGSITSTDTVKKRSKVSQPGSNFSEYLSAAETEEATQTGALSDVAATAALSNLLALQSISEEDVHRKKLVQQGKNLLDVLEKLRRQLLLGTLPPHLLQDLSRQLSLQKQLVNDPALTAIINDIELRAAVELAKLEMATRRGE